jgi:hypothetical protein
MIVNASASIPRVAAFRFNKQGFGATPLIPGNAVLGHRTPVAALAETRS